MTDDRLENLYEHSRLSLFELKARRLLILRGQSELNRSEQQAHITALNRLIRRKEGLTTWAA